MPEASIDHGILTVAEQRTSMRRPVRVKFRDARSFALRSLALDWKSDDSRCRPSRIGRSASRWTGVQCIADQFPPSASAH